MVIHIYLVYAIGVLFALAPLCIAPAISVHYEWAKRTLIGLSAAWAVLCPIFLLSPTSIDGLIERVLGLAACAIVFTLCAVFYLRSTRDGRATLS